MGARGVLRTATHGGLLFHCPGCNEMHRVNVGEGDGFRWGFNGDYDRPTFTPSVLIKSGHYTSAYTGPAETKPKDCWCNYEARFGKVPPFKCYVCHSFVTDGQIQFLGDCTHALAGRTVPLEPMAGAT